MTFSDIQGGYPGDGNINLDPLFVATGSGYFYLSQIDSGQDVDSPCLDAGYPQAENVCFTSSDVEICMNRLTTRTDEGTDEQFVDMEFHYLRSCRNHGDVNLDGFLSAGDAQRAFEIVLGAYTPDTAESCAADCNADEDITSGDVQAVFEAMLGMSTCADPI